MTEKFKFDFVVVRQAAPMREHAPSPLERMDPTIELVGARHKLARISNIEVTQQKLTMQEAAELRQQKGVVGAAPPMPLAPIRPLSLQSGQPPEPSPHPMAQWGVGAIGAAISGYTGKGVIVAVLDTGIVDPNQDHPAFRGVQMEFRNFTKDESKYDDDGHGTHCAGIIFGQDFDGVRTGIAPKIKKALIGKIAGRGDGETGDLVHAIQWALALEADVISMSFGMDVAKYIETLVAGYKFPRPRATSIALEVYRQNLRMFDKLAATALGEEGVMNGAVLVAAAGNESQRPDYALHAAPPAAAEGCLSVAALARPTSDNPALWPASNGGAMLAAPGEDIWSASHKGGFIPMSGTSMAAPHVAGAACLWVEKLRDERGSTTAKDVAEAMQKAARPLAPAISTEDVKWGAVSAP